MDKNTLVGFALIGAVVIGFQHLQPSQPGRNGTCKTLPGFHSGYRPKKSCHARTGSTAECGLYNTGRLYLTVLWREPGTEQLTTLENDLVKITFTNKGGRVCAATLKNYNGQDGKPLELFDEKDSGMNFAFEGKNENILTEDLYFRPTNVTDNTVTMRLATNGAGYIDFDYKLLPNTYVVNFSIRANGMQNFFPAAANTVNINWHQRARQLEKRVQL